MDPKPANIVRRVRAWPRRVLLTVTVIIVVLIGARVALPYVVRNQINKRLKDIPGYRGKVAWTGIHLYRGAYSLDGVSIAKVNGHQEDPFFVARYVDFSLSWGDLFRGKFVSRIFIDHPELTLV